MEYLNPSLKSEYDRWIKSACVNDNYGGSKNLSMEEVLRAHFHIADFFLAEGRDLGGIGPKSYDLLHSALYRQHIGFGGVVKWEDDFEKVATVLFGLVKDHPFHDANKRTAFLATLYFLQKLGYQPKVGHKQFEDFLVEIAEDGIKNRARYKDYEKNYEDPEVKYIAKWLRQNTREYDSRQYIVTFKELKRILNQFGFDLDNPQKNYIDVVQYKPAPRIPFFVKNPKNIKVKIGKVGFPGWTRQVNRGDLKYIRGVTKLNPENGVDSQAFYNGADPLNQLIAEYREPLRRLADR